jgi:hypothetical protein
MLHGHLGHDGTLKEAEASSIKGSYDLIKMYMSYK